MEFKRLTSTDTETYEKAMKLYAVSFPKHEQREEASQKAIMSDADYHFDCIYDSEDMVGIMLYWETETFIYIEHFCISPEMRNKQLGQKALEYLASQTDKKIQYIRYADDFILSVNGSREECIEIKKKLSQYISEVLKMQLSDEKTLITHSSNHARFLGYDISVRRNAKIKSKNGGVSLRTLNNKVELLIPLKEKINRFMFDKGVIFQKKDGSLFPTHRSYMIHMSDLEIISTYNSELRGICNYYNLASNYCQLRYFAYLMEYSCLKTLAAKHNTKISKIIAKFKDGKGGWGIPYETKSGKKRCYFAKYSDCKDSKDGTDNISNAAVIYGYSRNTLEERLKAKVCELCGDTNAEYYEIHHVHKVKDLKGKNDWERAMIAKRRKTLVLCRNCHYKVHNQ